MDELRIDRLTLNLTGLTEPEGRRLARLITEGLAAASLPAGAAVAAVAPGAIRLELAAPPSGSLGALSEQVVAEVLRQIQRSHGG